MIKQGHVLRTHKISDETKKEAKVVLDELKEFVRLLWSAKQHDNRLVDVLKKNQNVDPSALYEIRHLLRRFQKEVKDKYTRLIVMFAGKKNDKFELTSKGLIHLIQPFEQDTVIKQYKSTLQDAVQQLTEFMEEFLETFEDFNNPDQIKNIIHISEKADSIIQSIQNIIEKQFETYFEKNILTIKKSSSILLRKKLIKILVEK
jgi:hypothetical protein